MLNQPDFCLAGYHYEPCIKSIRLSIGVTQDHCRVLPVLLGNLFHQLYLCRKGCIIPLPWQIASTRCLQADGDIPLPEVELSGPVSSPCSLDPEGCPPPPILSPVSLDHHGCLPPQQESTPLFKASPGRLDTNCCPLLDILKPAVPLWRLTPPPPVLQETTQHSRDF